ncbi:MAG TPA: hypothetical protein VD864_01080 [Nocardioides sp.]|nr:hypothetical protein [Nocardioides sp.]
MKERGHLRLIPGGGTELPPLRLSTSHRSLHDLTHQVVQAAQDWTAWMIGSGAIERHTSDTEEGRLTLRLTDSVTEYEWYGLRAVPEAGEDQGPVTSPLF